MPLKNSYKEAVFAFLRRAMPQQPETETSEDDEGGILGNRALQAGFPFQPVKSIT